MIPASVVVASFRRVELLRACLASLAPQCARAGAELIVVRSGHDPAIEEASEGRASFVDAEPDDDIPRLRGRGLARARGRRVALTEDHCVPEPEWLERMLAAAPECDVVGGGMGNARTDRAVDWAAYFSEYGFFSSARPEKPGPPALTGANVAYASRVVPDVARWSLEGCWENVIHDRLRDRGCAFHFERAARVRQNDTYTFGAFCRDRFEHGYDYARVRLSESGAHRWTRLASVPLLPFLLTLRVGRTAFQEAPSAFIRSFPVIVSFLGAWSIGEAAGYLDGPVPE